MSSINIQSNTNTKIEERTTGTPYNHLKIKQLIKKQTEKAESTMPTNLNFWYDSAHSLTSFTASATIPAIPDNKP